MCSFKTERSGGGQGQTENILPRLQGQHVSSCQERAVDPGRQAQPVLFRSRESALLRDHHPLFLCVSDVTLQIWALPLAWMPLVFSSLELRKSTFQSQLTAHPGGAASCSQLGKLGLREAKCPPHAAPFSIQKTVQPGFCFSNSNSWVLFFVFHCAITDRQHEFQAYNIMIWYLSILRNVHQVHSQIRNTVLLTLATIQYIPKTL